MKKIFFLLLFFITTISTVNAQNGMKSHNYSAGGKMLMRVDSLAKNVFYGNVFPNQPHTSFNFLPEVNLISLQIYFRNTDSVQHYRYTILVDNKPILESRI